MAKPITTKLPIITVLIIAISLLATTSDKLAELLIYQRSAIDADQWWRLLSANFVHLSTSHLIANCSLLLVFGATVECTDKPNKIYFITLCALSLLLNGPCLYIFVQDLSVYGGISGLVTAVVFYWALQYYQAKGFKGLLGKFLIFALPLKIATEWKLSSSAIELFGSQDFYTVSLAHVTGLISAVLTYALRHWRQSWSGKAN